MTYELALKLRDAGFPQKNFPVEFRCVCGTKNDVHHADGRCVSYLVPLSELIEACGKDFRSLEPRTIIDHVEWFATQVFNKEEMEKEGYYLATGYVPGRFINKGDSPEEAVAKLWLKLND